MANVLAALFIHVFLADEKGVKPKVVVAIIIALILDTNKKSIHSVLWFGFSF